MHVNAKNVVSLCFVLMFFESLFSIYLEYRRIRKQRDARIPKYFAQVLSQEEYDKSRAYITVRAKLSILKEILSAVELFVVVYFKLYVIMWNLSERIAFSFGFNKDSEILISIIFMILTELLSNVISIPVSYFETFNIEAKFNFNKQTRKMFFVDLIKMQLVSIVTDIPIFAFILWVFKHRPGGDKYWLIAYIVFMIFFILMQSVYQKVIMPMFNKFTPLTDEEIAPAIKEFCERCNFAVKDVFEIDGSRRSSKSNAFFVGLFGKKEVVLYDTLLDMVRKDKLIEKEHILAVLGHEIGHAKHHDIWKMIGMYGAMFLFMFYAFSKTVDSPEIHAVFGFEEKHTIVGFMAFMTLVYPLLSILSALSNPISRSFEYQADKYSHDMGCDIGTPLVVLSTENLLDFNPDPIHSFYYNSHPSLSERLKALNWVAPEGIKEKRLKAKALKKEREEKEEAEKQEKIKKMKEGLTKKEKDDDL
ncbi:putative Metalloprotease [Monocercomonoides exilis]|uniref:putative Metalloprotease n=1 Tax=Monocercomonoides exilis TaxID=2049356 RepID=UPI0035597793|nr:putative Metalloprotease [Monocercomonoides exilis]|eukprot:MONOS_2561.1-p1 / transcript=MONOS_2561.1 / gene=MONOS_2561 / organism=Monocercomonoides_exilis_PA203 / gene_product=Metalloprotease / transcript_product=Metalloprotease / location=Mono_scaffold00053:137619-140026(+) / protein_length=475 / sequence_SO=supercontig / SO=protein_coding / is_pseudo=false